MKVRRQIRFRTLPTDFSFGWRNHRLIVRMSREQTYIAEKLGIPLKDYAEALVAKRFKSEERANG